MIIGAMLLLLSGQAAAEDQTDRAGNRFEALAASPGAGEGRRCTADRAWCAQLRRADGGGWRLETADGIAYAVAAADDEEEAALWPHIVREAGGAAILGVELHRSTGFAGGGASATRLELVRLAPGAVPERLLEVPTSSALSLRACFGPDDERRRAGACLTELDFAGRLTLDPAAAEGRPRLRFAAEAHSYPYLHARYDEEARTLTRTGLARARDPDCSYERVFAFDPAAGAYLPDRPLPDCSEYLDF